MSKGNTWENDLLLLVFNNTNAANIGDATGLRGSTTVGSLFLSLHTADPGEAGDQTTSEATYTGYARVAVARTTGGFTVSANAVTLVANTDFGACTAGTNTITHFAIGTASTGTGKVLYKGALSPSISVTSGVTPRILSGTIVTED
jgi:hypothetical protein